MSWNGLVISAFARASQILKDEPEGTRFYFPVVGSNVSLHLSTSRSAYIASYHDY